MRPGNRKDEKNTCRKELNDPIIIPTMNTNPLLLDGNLINVLICQCLLLPLKGYYQSCKELNIFMI